MSKPIISSGVGTLLQFSNKTRPDITNAVRELSRGMDKATKAAEKEMYRIMKYLIQTKDYGLKLHPTKNLENGLWTLTIYSDSDWASNKEDRKSITGFTIFLQGCANFMEISGTENCFSLQYGSRVLRNVRSRQRD